MGNTLVVGRDVEAGLGDVDPEHVVGRGALRLGSRLQTRAPSTMRCATLLVHNFPRVPHCLFRDIPYLSSLTWEHGDTVRLLSQNRSTAQTLWTPEAPAGVGSQPQSQVPDRPSHTREGLTCK